MDVSKVGSTPCPVSGAEDTAEGYPGGWDQSLLENAGLSPPITETTKDAHMDQALDFQTTKPSER